MTVKGKYKDAIQSLKSGIRLVQIALLGSALTLFFAFECSIAAISFVGLFDEGFGRGLWLVWPTIAITFAAVGWIELVFVKKARALFDDPDIPIEAFGTSMADEAQQLDEVKQSLRYYCLATAIPALAIGAFFPMPFVNIALGIALVAILLGLRSFLRQKEACLYADRVLVEQNQSS